MVTILFLFCSMIKQISSVKLDVGTISIKENGILYVDYYKDANIDLNEVILVGEKIVELCNGIPRLFIIDVRDCYGNYSMEARNYMANNPEINKVRKAFAILTNSLGTRILADFYLKFNKPPSPGKLFNDEEEAIQWLMDHQ